MGQPRPLFHLFSSFQTYITIFQQKNLKKCPFSIRCHDSNSWPLEHESPLITTRPGVPPVSMLLLSLTFIASIGLLYKTKIPSSYETVFFCILVFLSVAVAIIWTCMVKWSANWPSTSTIWVQTPQFFVGNCWKRKIGRDWPFFKHAITNLPPNIILLVFKKIKSPLMGHHCTWIIPPGFFYPITLQCKIIIVYLRV